MVEDIFEYPTDKQTEEWQELLTLWNYMTESYRRQACTEILCKNKPITKPGVLKLRNRL